MWKRSLFRNDVSGQRHIPGQGELVGSRLDQVRIGRGTVQAADVPGKNGVHSRSFMEKVVCNSMLPLLSAVLVTMRLPVPVWPGLVPGAVRFLITMEPSDWT